MLSPDLGGNSENPGAENDYLLHPVIKSLFGDDFPGTNGVLIQSDDTLKGIDFDNSFLYLELKVVVGSERTEFSSLNQFFEIILKKYGLDGDGQLELERQWSKASFSKHPNRKLET